MIASKIGQSEEFRKYEKYSLDDCFQKALHFWNLGSKQMR